MAMFGMSKPQVVIFATLYLSYVGIYVCRKNYSNLVQTMTSSTPDLTRCNLDSPTTYSACMEISSQCTWTGSNQSCATPDHDFVFIPDDERLSLEQVGRLGSSFQLAAAVSKLVTPVFIDTHSPRYLLAGSLFLCALINIAMSFFTHNLFALTVLWGANGFINAIGWPALSKSFLAWFPNPEQRGTLYSIMSTNQSIGAALAPIIVLYGARWLGNWKAVLIAPGCVGVAISMVVFVLVADKDDGDNDDDDGDDDDDGTTTKRNKASSNTPQSKANAHAHATASTSPRDMTTLLWTEVFTNPAVYMLGGCHMCVLLVRDGFSDLSVKYLQEVWHYSDTATTGCVWMIHIGAFVGSLVAGWVSDTIYHGKRAPVIGWSIGGCVVPLVLLLHYGNNQALSTADSGVFDVFVAEYAPRVCFFMFGVFSFTPHVLLGLMAREITSPQAQSTSAGTAKLVAHLGGAMAGSPLGYVVETNGWNGGLQVLSAASLVGFGMMVPLWSRGAWKRKGGTMLTVKKKGVGKTKKKGGVVVEEKKERRKNGGLRKRKSNRNKTPKR
jgi:OPA family sugar phosphate sensor protein UhpC-like MFS transporter